MSEIMKNMPFNSGEVEVQKKLGVHEQVMSYAPRVIRNFMPDQHRAFYGQLPMIYTGWVDEKKRPWASVLFGESGFISSPHPKTLKIMARPPLGDPLEQHLTKDRALGFLGLEHQSRRRNRLTGKVTDGDGKGFEIKVDQSFGNCPQYIQPRTFEIVANHKPGAVHRIKGLNQRTTEIIKKARSFFIASYYMEDPNDPTHGADMSHRGGKPGFVNIEEDGSLIFPDFSGNNHYNTLGNLHKNPVAGLLFQDFETGDLLQLTCSAEILWEDERIQDFQGALRFVRFKIDEGVLIENGMPMRWGLLDEAYGVAQSGSWEDAAKRQQSREEDTPWTTVRVVRVEPESSNINSYYLESVDQKPLPAFKPGQFLPIRILSPVDGKPIYRSYTLSGKSGTSNYRLSIKREDAGPNRPPGLVSNLFHDRVKPDSLIEAMKPQGEFVIDPSVKRPMVLLSAGVGITPMVSMLEGLCALHPERKIWFLHGTQNGRTHAFREDIQAMALSCPSLTIHTRYSQPLPEDIKCEDYQDAGRLDLTLLKSLLPFDDYDFYICGPEGFMKELYAGLREMNISPDRIHHEFFGKGSIHEEPETGQASVAVQFKTSQTEATWEPGKGSLLDLAEEAGLEPPAGCRSGACLTCVTKIISGSVHHQGVAKDNAPKGCALLCSATPNSQEPLVLDL